jgi:transketolase
MREAFARTLTRLAGEDERIAFVTGDLGFGVFDEFKEKYGPRYINVGVAEAQMVYTAAGLALEGFLPVAYSIASFATARPYEQIRFCLAYPNLPVLLVGAGRGYLYSTSGVSHHAPDDLALMGVLPNMTVVAPGDPTEVEQLLPQLLQLSGPSYFTVGRYGEPRYEAEEPAVLGRARCLRSGERVALLTVGEIANETLCAVTQLHSEGIHPLVCQFHTVKPLDTAALDAIADRVDTIIVIEEHLPLGGLWSAVCDWRARTDCGVRLERLGGRDAFALGNLNQAELRRRLGLDADGIVSATRSAWAGKKIQPVNAIVTERHSVLSAA